ncbi:MAG: hypothetical protein FWC42_11340 [Proteobacteria bacterium]|nr:hypothetical protein [Pseudomonadota bacterium]
MKTFKKNALFAALAGLGAVGLVGSAQAVNLNPDGLGQVLIYPYYTTRGNADGNSFQSLISVVNSTDMGKAVKVRFLEGKASQEVLDFNLYLSAFDVWTGYVTPEGEGAKLQTNDNSCTYPAIPAGGVAFRNYQYTGPNADQEDQTLNRTKEGYVEIIEMADIDPTSPTGIAITHVNGVPKDCSKIADSGTQPAWVATDLDTGTGGLFGAMTLLSVNDGNDVSFEATALDAFFTGPGHLWKPAGSILPNLADVKPAVSTVVNGPDVYITQWAAPGIKTADPVSAVLMNNSVYNEYVLDDSILARTDWVVTMPTKSYYYSGFGPKRERKVQKLFQRDFVLGGACDDMGVIFYDREERHQQATGDFSPPPPAGASAALCWEANVVTFGNARNTPSALRAENRYNLTLPPAYVNGWAEFDFSPVPAAPTNIDFNVGTAHVLTSTLASQYIDLSVATPAGVTVNTTTFTGLPMVGFAVQQLNNGEAVSADFGKIWASYAGRIAHRFSKLIAGQ